MADGLSAEEIVLSEERRAVIAPKLRVLLDDFRHLVELETPETEPAVTPWMEGEDRRERR